MLLERAGEVGGTWHVNTYPGCRCDVPSHLYSFSFAPNPEWSSTFSPQPEILRLPAAAAPSATGSCPTCASTPRWPARHGTRTPGSGGSPPSQGEITAEVLDLRAGRPERAAAAGHPGHRELRGRHLPLRALEPRPRPDRRARGGDRHGRLGDPVRARDPAQGREAPRVPAHRAVGDAPFDARTLSKRRATALPAPARGAAGHARPPSTGGARRSSACSATRGSASGWSAIALRHLNSPGDGPRAARAS